MFNCVTSGTIRGISGQLVKVETDVSAGMPMFELVGYLGSEVKEASQRVRTALKNTGYNLPVARVTVNLAPADIRKSGTGYDLPIALGLLVCMEIIPPDALLDTFVVGELMLSGSISYVKGILPMILEARNNGVKRCIIPKSAREEGSLVEGIEVIGVESLKEAIDFLTGDIKLEPYECRLKSKLNENKDIDHNFSQIRGQEMVKRGAQICAAGLHNMLMLGAPGTGKTMIAKCIPGILPPLNERECLEISSIYSVRGILGSDETIKLNRPFVEVHHTASDIALIGGGATPRPGAVSLAHNGVLFLDEIPEFSRKSLEALRQPLEDRQVTITRNKDVCVYPSDFMLVAAMNPCPCGYYPDRNKCTCTDFARTKYLSKISGPLMDRIDVCVTTEKIKTTDLSKQIISKKSEDIRESVILAHKIEKERFKHKGISFNSQMNNEDIEKYCKLGSTESDYLNEVVQKYDLSARAYYRVLRIARTIADLSGEDSITCSTLSEATMLKCSVIL